MRKVLRSKLPPVAREFSGGGAFALCFERNCDIAPAIFDRGGRVYYLLDAIFSVHMRGWSDASTASAWAALRNKKEQKLRRNLKRFLKEIYQM